jgi:hypothetical protein
MLCFLHRMPCHQCTNALIHALAGLLMGKEGFGEQPSEMFESRGQRDVDFT